MRQCESSNTIRLWLRRASIIIALLFVLFLIKNNFGKHPYPVLINDISWDVCQILKKHGLAINNEYVEEKGTLVGKTRDQPYYRSDAAPGSYTLLLYMADEIPQEAKTEIIRYCMDLYEKRGRKERFKIFMYRESAPQYHSWFSGPKPYFKLTIGGNN